MQRSALLAASLLGAALLACAADSRSDGAQAQARTEAGRDSTANADGTPESGGVPPGGLEDWIADIRRGLAALPDRLATDPAAARMAAIELYAGRQEYIEVYYGENGRLTAGEALGPAVEHAEEEFHALMLLLSGEAPPDTAQVRAAIAAIDAAYDRVLEEARRAGVPLTPDAAAARSGS